MRHTGRTHRIDLDWLFERFHLDPVIQIRFGGTKEQIADFLTKGAFAANQWKELCKLAQIGNGIFKQSRDAKSKGHHVTSDRKKDGCNRSMKSNPDAKAMIAARQAHDALSADDPHSFASQALTATFRPSQGPRNTASRPASSTSSQWSTKQEWDDQAWDNQGWNQSSSSSSSPWKRPSWGEGWKQ